MIEGSIWLPAGFKTAGSRLFLLFLLRSEEEEVWHTNCRCRELCARDCSFSFWGGGGVAHEFNFRGFVCHGFFIFLCRLMRSGTRSSF